jgi:hypothetical protein
LLIFAAVLFVASPASGSEEDLISWSKVFVECEGTTETGKVSVNVEAAPNGYKYFRVTGFGKSFELDGQQLETLKGFPLDSLRTTHSAGYPRLGGHTISFSLRRTWYDEKKKLRQESAWVSITKGQGLRVAKNEDLK